MNIRMETNEDFAQVYEVNYEAFGNSDDEAKLVERIRASEGFVPELSLVAEVGGSIVGHVLVSKALVVGSEARHEVLVLAPIAVRPSCQKQGVGTKLITEAQQRSKELGASLILLIGHPGYYPKFGFKPARAFGIDLLQFEVPDEVFMVYEVTGGSLEAVKGELVYPAAFF